MTVAMLGRPANLLSATSFCCNKFLSQADSDVRLHEYATDVTETPLKIIIVFQSWLLGHQSLERGYNVAIPFSRIILIQWLTGEYFPLSDLALLMHDEATCQLAYATIRQSEYFSDVVERSPWNPYLNLTDDSWARLPGVNFRALHQRNTLFDSACDNIMTECRSRGSLETVWLYLWEYSTMLEKWWPPH